MEAPPPPPPFPPPSAPPPISTASSKTAVSTRPAANVLQPSECVLLVEQHDENDKSALTNAPQTDVSCPEPFQAVDRNGDIIARPQDQEGNEERLSIVNEAVDAASKHLEELEKTKRDMHTLQEENLTFKARSMFEMVEPLDCFDSASDAITPRILFLTNKQARLLAGQQSPMIERLIEAFEIKPPKLIIQLLFSPGGFGWYDSLNENQQEMSGEAHPGHPGVRYGRPPWMTMKEGLEAEAAIGRFMKEILIPVAADNQALVVCSAVRGECMLSEAFNSTLQEEKARWGKQMPITVLGSCGQIKQMYHAEEFYNSNRKGRRPWSELVWTQIRSRSRNWKKRDPVIKEVVGKHTTGDPILSDLNPNVMNYIVVDTIEGEGQYRSCGHISALNELMENIVRHFSSTIPCVTIKTGMSGKDVELGMTEDAASLQVALNAVISGSPLLFLDARRRTLHGFDDLSRDGSRELSDEDTEVARQGRTGLVIPGVADSVVPGSPDTPKKITSKKSVVVPLPSTGTLRTHVADTTYIPEDRMTLINVAMRCYNDIAEEYMADSGGPGGGGPSSFCIYDVMDLAWFREVLRGYGDIDPDDDEDVYGFHIPHFVKKSQKPPKLKKKHSRGLFKNLAHSLDQHAAVCVDQIADLGQGTIDAVVGESPPKKSWRHYKPALHEAIQYFQQIEGNPDHLEPGSAGYMGDAPPYQIEQVASFLADVAFRQAERALDPNSDTWKTRRTCMDMISFDPKRDKLRKQRETWKKRAEALLKHQHLHCMNVHEHLVDARKVIEQLVKLERLPKRSCIEGLRLLRQAWDDYDCTWYLASRYKILAKVTFLLQVVLGLLAVCVTVFHMDLMKKEAELDFCDAFVPLANCASLLNDLQKKKIKLCKEHNIAVTEKANGTFAQTLLHHSLDSAVLDDLIFLLPVCSTLVLGIFSFLNPQQRWRNLRNCACNLESLTWLYRTRVEPFTVSSTNKHLPEDILMGLLNEWRDSLAEGSDLNMTTMEQKHDKYSPVWRHYQYTGKLGDPVGFWYGRWARRGCRVLNDFLDGDLSFAWCRRCCPGRKPKLIQHLHGEEHESVHVNDFYSPCKPQNYIRLRLLTHKEFYQRRLPGYVRQRYFYHCLAIMCTTTGAVFGYYGMEGFVAGMSAIAGAITAWTEFIDVGRKLERYSSAIRSIKKIIAWWESLTDVDQSSVANISRLVLEGERIIMGELSGWGQGSRSKDAKPEENKAAKDNQPRPAGGQADKT